MNAMVSEEAFDLNSIIQQIVEREPNFDPEKGVYILPEQFGDDRDVLNEYSPDSKRPTPEGPALI